jgi:hypothetical protein
MANQLGASVSEFSNAGVAISPSGGYTGGSLVNPIELAIDGAGNVWGTNRVLSGAKTPLPGIVEFSKTGKLMSPPNQSYVGPGTSDPYGIAIDGSGDVWVTADDNSQTPLYEFVGLATPVITPICAGLPATPTADGSSHLGTRP